MNTHSRLAKSVRLALAFSVASTTALTANTVVAQEAEGEDNVEKIAVTGSRIQRTNLVSSTPVTEITAADIALSGITRMEDLLNDMPAILASQTSNISNGSAGTATVDLRGLGSERTLVLINGRRLPLGTPLAGAPGVDVNTIPAGLVERVEVLTGGSSATYGSDAIAGVVNFIMKDDFEGFEFDYNFSFYQHDNDNSALQNVNAASGFEAPTGSVTDGHQREFSMTFGANTADGRGNVTMYASFRNIDEIRQGSRDFSNCALNLNASGDYVCVGSSTIPETRITDFGLVSGFDFKVAGTDFVPRDGTTYNYGEVSHFQRPDERKALGGFAKYEINDHVELYGEVNFADTRSIAQIAPSGAFFVTSSISCSNPLLSGQQFDALCAANGLTAADNITAFIGRRNVEGAERQNELNHTAFRGVMGARGVINDDWSYDVFANWGTTRFSQVYQNDLSSTRILRALDAVDDGNGNIICRSALPDPTTGAAVDPNCVPWNVFETGGVTQAAINYITLPLFSKGETVSSQVSGYVAGDLTSAGWVVPGTTTGVSVVFGAERRTEKLVLEPDQGFQTGDGAGQGGPTAPVTGEYDVEEFFSEALIPLLEDQAFAESLNLELAYRYSDYSTDKTTDTYKFGVDWGINEDVRVRTSFQRAVRAGNVRELFRPATLGLFNMNADPCFDGSLTQAQCANTGLDAAFYQSPGLNNPAGQYNSITGGNPDLDPEESDTVAFGLVISPSAIPELNIALDWFNIEVEGAISNIPEPTIIQSCGETGDPTFCDLIFRGAAGDLWIGSNANSGRVVATDINIGFFETSGVDFDVSYKLGVGDMGELDFNLVGTYLTKWDQETSPGNGIQDCLGGWDRSVCGATTIGPKPEWRWNFRTAWTTPWDATVSATLRFFGEVDEIIFDANQNRTDGPTPLDSQMVLDIAASWNVLDNTTLRFGINNALDDEPPIIPNGPSGFSNGNTFPHYDLLGRNIFMGVNVSF